MTRNAQQELLPGTAKRVGRGWRWRGFELDHVQDPAESVSSGSPQQLALTRAGEAACLTTRCFLIF
jgi:hypothetical protein